MTTKITNNNIAIGTLTVNQLATGIATNLYTAGTGITIEANGRISASSSSGPSIASPNCLAFTNVVKNVLKFGNAGTVEASLLGLSKTELGAVDGIAFDPDGNRMYLLDRPTDSIYECYLYEPFIVANARYTGNSFTLAASQPQDLIFKPDGTKCYIASDSTLVGVAELELSVPWDISSATTANTYTTSAQETGPKALHIGDNGTKLFLIGTGSDTVFEYTLGDAWSFGDVTYSGNSYDIVTESTPTSLFFSDDGTKFYSHGTGSDTLSEYRMSTPWDVTTVTKATPLIDVIGVVGAPTTWKAANAGHNVFMIDTTDDVIRSYYMPTAWDPGITNFGYNALEATPFSFFVSPNGTRLYLSGTVNDTVIEFELGTAYDVSTANTTGSTLSLPGSTSGRSLSFNDDGNILITSALSTDDISKYTLSTPWDISTATLASSNTFATQGLYTPFGVEFNNDGTKLYGVRDSTSEFLDYVLQYTCASPYDIDNMSIEDPLTYSSSIFGSYVGTSLLRWNEDGSKVYLLNNQAAGSYAAIYEYSASTAYNLWSVNWDSNKHLYLKNVYGSTGGATIRDFQFQGGYLYFMDSNGDTIYQMRLA